MKLGRYLNASPLTIEGVGVALFLTFFLILNINISLEVQPVWLDEVTVADPAVNLFQGNGFTSTGWQYQKKDEFWASNAPLHQILLFHWLKVFGFNPYSVRAISIFFFVITIFLIWFTTVRLNILSSIIHRILMLVLLLGGAGITMSYISGRYDCIGIFLVAMLFFTYTVKNDHIRMGLFILTGILIPLAGIHLIPYVGVLGIILFIIMRKEIVSELLFTLLGICIGFAFLYTLYVTNDVFKVILASAGGHGLAGAVNPEIVHELPETDIAGKLLYVLQNIPFILFNRFKHIFRWYSQNISYLILMIGIIISFIINLRQKKGSRLLLFGLAVGISVPMVLGFLRDYPFYYTWMAYLPLVIVFSSEIPGMFRNRIISIISLCVLAGIAVYPGFVHRFLSTVIIPSHYTEDYFNVSSKLSGLILPEDVLYSDFPFYYAAKEKRNLTFLPTYKDMFSDDEKNSISLLVIKPENESFVLSFLGGTWQKIDEGMRNTPYGYSAYRREER